MTIDQWSNAETDDFQHWIASQRWYGDKSRIVERITPEQIAEIDLDGTVYGLIQVTFDFADGASSVYFAPQVIGNYRPCGDALLDHHFLHWLGSGFDEPRTIETDFGGGSRLTWKPVEQATEAYWWHEPARVLEGEQSNTSVIFGESAIVKVFRKMQPGINPDSEIVSFLTAEGGFDHVPSFLGSITFERGDGRDSIELGSVQAFVRNQGDCWRWLPDALTKAEVPDLELLADSVRLLGQRTGELHVALAANSADDAFRPLSIDQDHVSALEGRLGREVCQTISMLHRQGACSHAESEALAAALLGDISRADVLLGALQTRVHGDYHLGQVLRTDDDFVIIDFEGEPSRSMPERRHKNSPLKDVAGMLRSIDYAVATANEDGRAGRDKVLEQWGKDAERSFSDGYMGAVSITERDLVPTEPEAFHQALDLFMIEKALYEVRYELDNRPDWLQIPLDALKRIAGEN